MPVEADDGLSTTSTGSDVRGAAELRALRWVHPMHELVTILTESVVLGRSPSASTQLDTSRVSRKHAEVKLVSGAYVVSDLKSKNGVFVNGEKVQAAGLGVGDVLRLGDCVAVVEATALNGLPGFRDLGQGLFGGAALSHAVERVLQAARRGADVMLVGETGTGKELLARAFHRLSGRKGAFVIFDCAAGPEAGRAADLFGQSDAALSDGAYSSFGQVRAADQGSIVLDSILDLSLELQAKLVAVMERREVTPIGETRSFPVDVRFVAKSLLGFDEKPADGFDPNLRKHFGKEVIQVPPLRERRADIVPLFRMLLGRHGGGAGHKLEPELVEELCLRDWPLNLRELDLAARRVLATSAGRAELELSDLTDEASPRAPRALRGSSPPPAPSRRVSPSYSPKEIDELRAALERHQGNLTKAASELDITRSKAYRMLRIARDED